MPIGLGRQLQQRSKRRTAVRHARSALRRPCRVLVRNLSGDREDTARRDRARADVLAQVVAHSATTLTLSGGLPHPGFRVSVFAPKPAPLSTLRARLSAIPEQPYASPRKFVLQLLELFILANVASAPDARSALPGLNKTVNS